MDVEEAGTGPRGVDRRTRRRQQTRREILAAAWDLAERDGVASLSLRDLAGAVGMRAPSLYTYFDSKGAIYDAMFADGYRALHAELVSLRDVAGDTAEMLRVGTERFLGFCLASLPRYQLLFTRSIPDWEPAADAYAVSVAAYDEMVAQLARAGIEGQPAIDLWTAVTAGLAAQQFANDPGGDRWIRLADDAARMFAAYMEADR